MRHTALLLFALLLGCPAADTSTAAVPAPPADTGGDAVASGLVGDWRGYPDPGEDAWETAPLDDDRWMQTTAELACIGRAHHGDPDRHRVALRQVLARRQTTAESVMEYGVKVNEDGARALVLGARVADATQTCN